MKAKLTSTIYIQIEDEMNMNMSHPNWTKLLQSITQIGVKDTVGNKNKTLSINEYTVKKQ